MVKIKYPRVVKVRPRDSEGKITKPAVRKLFDRGVITKRDIFAKSNIQVDTTSPAAFKKSVTRLRRKGLTLEEQRRLRIAKARAAAQILRPNISKKEKKQFKEILKVPIPKVYKERSVAKRARGPMGRFL